MTANDNLTNHTWDAHSQYAQAINHDKGTTTILSGHIWETPYIAQSGCRTGGSQNHSKLTSKICSCHFFVIFLFISPHRRETVLRFSGAKLLKIIVMDSILFKK
jgi:hypothetical protein